MHLVATYMSASFMCLAIPRDAIVVSRLAARWRSAECEEIVEP